MLPLQEEAIKEEAIKSYNLGNKSFETYFNLTLNRTNNNGIKFQKFKSDII